MLYLHEATVEVHVRFPVDMLRYDSCFPATTEDAVAITKAIMGPRLVTHVRLQAFSQNKTHWTPERWKSFGIEIIETSVRKA